MLKFQKTKNPTEEKPRPRRPKDMTKTQEGASRKEEPASHRQRAKLGKHYAINKMPLRVGQDRASATRSSRNLRGRAAELVQPGRRTPGERGKPRKGAELLRPGRRTPGEQRKPAEARPSFCSPAEGPRGSRRKLAEGRPSFCGPAEGPRGSKGSPRKQGRAFAARPKDPGGAFAKAMKVSPTSKDADEDLHCIAIRRRTFVFFCFRRCAFKLSKLFVDPSKMFVDHSKMFVDPSKMFVDEHF